MLAIVEVLREYRNFLLGAKITIFTDHKNLLANTSANDCVFRWKQKIEEFTPTIQYVQGQTNIEADALSRLLVIDGQGGLEVMLNYPQLDTNNPILNSYPLDLTIVNKYQQLDQTLMKTVKENHNFQFIQLYNNQLVAYQLQRSKKQCIVIPQQLQYPAVRWLHSILGHAGSTRLTETLSSHFWFPNMKEMVTRVVRNCEHCQRYKVMHQHYGHVPPKNIKNFRRWEEGHIIKNTIYLFLKIVTYSNVISPKKWHNNIAN